MKKPWYQKIITSYIPWIVTGFIFVGSLLDTVSNTIELITPSVTYFGTLIAALLVIFSKVLLTRYPVRWVTEDNQRVYVRSFGIAPILTLVGVLVALWIPRFFGNHWSNVPRTMPTVSNYPTIETTIPVTDTTIPIPAKTPDVTNLYTYFPPPTINSMRTYKFSVIYSDFSDGENEQKIDTGSFSEVVRIVNDKYKSDGITIVGLERVGGGDYVAPCPDKFYWYVYDANRFYLICSKNYVDAAGSKIAADTASNLVVYSQFEAEPLNIMPHYLAPFEIDKRWQADYRITIQDKLTKETPAGTFHDCFKILFFMIHYEEFRYVCPFVGVVAIEVSSRGDFYSAELASLK